MGLRIEDQYGNPTDMPFVAVGYEYTTGLYYADIEFDDKFRRFFLPWVNGIRPLRRIWTISRLIKLDGEWFRLVRSEWINPERETYWGTLIIRLYLHKIKAV